MGCQVSVVDLEERYLSLIRQQASELGLSIDTFRGLFGDPVGSKRFDRVLFYEAFHHSLDHSEVLEKLKHVIAPDGKLLIAGEPILSKESHWLPTLPFPWGPRLDGLSLRSMRTYGWCELGFRREYFIERLMRSGWLVSYIQCPMTDRGNVFVAELNRGTVELGKSYVIEATGGHHGWHAGEGTVRWTKGSAVFPLDQSLRATAIEITLHNYLPIVRNVRLKVGKVANHHAVPPGETVVTLIHLPRDYESLEITCEPIVMSKVLPRSSDDRAVGVCVSTIRYA